MSRLPFDRSFNFVELKGILSDSLRESPQEIGMADQPDL
jgi:hypothetical protein